MPLYRVLSNLTRGQEELIKAGTVETLAWLKQKHIAVLVERGAVSEVHAPPLEVLPGWTVRAEKLAPYGIIDVGRFLETPAAQLAEWMEVKVETIELWRRELLEWLKAPQERGR